jgi:hypothetical protein
VRGAATPRFGGAKLVGLGAGGVLRLGPSVGLVLGRLGDLAAQGGAETTADVVRAWVGYLASAQQRKPPPGAADWIDVCPGFAQRASGDW